MVGSGRYGIVGSGLDGPVGRHYHTCSKERRGMVGKDMDMTTPSHLPYWPIRCLCVHVAS